MPRILLLLLLVLISAPLLGQTTADPRRWPVENAQWLEEHPLDPEAGAKRRELMKFWGEVKLSVCPLFMEVRNVRIASIVVTQAIVSAGAYWVDHRDATRAEYSLAGAEAALRAYRNAVAADPKLQNEFLDGLLAAKSRETYVTAAVRKCEKAMKR